MALVQAIASNAPQVIQAALKLMLALAAGLIQALPQIIVAVGKIGLAIVQALLSIVGALISAGVQILQALWQGMSSWVDTLVSKAVEVGRKVFNGIKSGLGNLLDIGRSWLAGLWNGISSWIGSFISDLRSKLSEAAGLAKKIFKIGSPSKLMFQYGVWFMEGLENGIDRAYKPLMKNLNKQMEAIVSVYNPLTSYDFGVGESTDLQMLKALNNLGQTSENTGTNNSIVQNITVDGSKNPEETAELLARQLKISMRTL